MSTHKKATDIQGRPYLTPRDAKPGTVVQCDGDFTCIGPGERRMIKKSDEGFLYLDCRLGMHSLNGQLSEDGGHYVGLYKASLSE